MLLLMLTCYRYELHTIVKGMNIGLVLQEFRAFFFFLFFCQLAQLAFLLSDPLNPPGNCSSMQSASGPEITRVASAPREKGAKRDQAVQQG